MIELLRKRRSIRKYTSQPISVQRLLGLPEHIKVASIISIGYPDETKATIPTSELEYHKVKHNHYSRPL